MPRQPAHSSAIQPAARPAEISPVASAGDTTNAIENVTVDIALARPRTRSPARLFTRGASVGASTVSPSPNRPANAKISAIRAPLAPGTADNPKIAQEALQIRPISASALLRRSDRTSRSMKICARTMTAVFTVSASATMCTGTRETTEA